MAEGSFSDFSRFALKVTRDASIKGNGTLISLQGIQGMLMDGQLDTQPFEVLLLEAMQETQKQSKEFRPEED